MDQFFLKVSVINNFEVVQMKNMVTKCIFFDESNIVTPCVDLFEHD